MKLKFFVFLISLGVCEFANMFPAHAAPSPYRLGIVVVIDQFRADYLTLHRSDFLPPAQKGFRFLMEGGAFFPLADHELFQNMTCPGHAGILTGAFPYRHGIPINNWFNRDTQRAEYCVSDSSSLQVGSDGVSSDLKFAMSPKNMNATTVGDELKNAGLSSQVISISIKDRSAITLGGKRADQTVWLNSKSCQWVTSQFYTKESTLPEWAKNQNLELKKFSGKKYSWGPHSNVDYCSRESIGSPWGVEETFRAALAAVRNRKLGKGKHTDLLTISLSSHDYLGHQVGPNSVHAKAMTLAEDRLVGEFLMGISKELGGLDSVFVVLTGDHGVQPTPDTLPPGLPHGVVKQSEFNQTAEKIWTEAFGKPKGGKWIDGNEEFQIYLNPIALSDAKVTSKMLARELGEKLRSAPWLDRVWSRDEIMDERKLPPGELGKIIDQTVHRRSGDLMLVLNPFFVEDGAPVSHMTHYSYDRYVPLVLWGKTLKSGTFRQIVRIVDIAPTLSSMLGILPPAQSEGRVLSEALR